MPQEMGRKQDSSLFEVFKANRLSLHFYSFPPYPGRITLFCASEDSKEEKLDPTLGWGKLAMGGIDMHRIAGNHFSIVRSPVLAERLKAFLNQTGSRS